MTVKEFRKQLIEALSNQKTKFHILESDASLLITCYDKSSFLLNILESKFTFLHNNCADEEVEYYFATHSNEEFAQDILSTLKSKPAFFFFYMICTKLEEKKIIDSALFYHILDSVISDEQEFEEFLTRVLWNYNNKYIR